MAHSILAEDFCALCLWLAGGDLHRSMAELIEEARRYQQEAGSHFGTSAEDFEMALTWAALERSLLDWRCIREELLARRKQEIRLHELLPLLLRFDDVTFNDEGEHWKRSPRLPRSPLRDTLARIFAAPAQDSAPGEQAASVLSLLEQAGFVRELLPRYLESNLWLTELDEQGRIRIAR